VAVEHYFPICNLHMNILYVWYGTIPTFPIPHAWVCLVVVSHQVILARTLSWIWRIINHQTVIFKFYFAFVKYVPYMMHHTITLC
jgi:hypothetical protein